VCLEQERNQSQGGDIPVVNKDGKRIHQYNQRDGVG